MLTGTSNRHRHILTLGSTVASTCPVELTLPNLPPGAGAKLTSAHTSDLTQTLPPPPLPARSVQKFRLKAELQLERLDRKSTRLNSSH